MTLFLDTAVLMYAFGADHPLRAPCRAILDRVGDRRIDAMISAEVVQEVLHRFVAIRRPETGAEIARGALSLFAPVLPITHGVVSRMPDLVARYPRLTARDLVHVATCVEEGIAEIVTPDRSFDVVAEIRRIDPADFAV
jgi:hypothetical protein